MIDINEEYQDEDYKVKANDYPSRLLMQNYYGEDDSKELVHISVEKDNPHLFHVNSWYKITGDSFYNKYFDRIMIMAKHISEVGNSYIEE